MFAKYTRLLGLILGALPSTQAGLFTVQCGPLTIHRGDPIVFPGEISPHVHAVVGGTAFSLGMSNEDARNSEATTCNKMLDKSNYWQPQLYHQDKDGKFELVEFSGMTAYYIDRACDYEEGRTNCDGADSAVGPPAGLRMVVGDPLRKTYDQTNPEHRAMSHVCLNPGRDTTELYQEPCEEMRAQTFFPSCWNGKDLDSDDHKSHMAFPAIGDYNGGVCPESHPTAIVSVFFEFFYNTGHITDFNRWVYASGDGVGYGLHGDYLQGWEDQELLDMAIATCTGENGVYDPDCSINVGPNGTPGDITVLDPVTPAPDEEVGFNGKLEKLPGDNPPWFEAA